MELWRDIKGYEGLYQVSNLGRVRSMLYGKVRILKPEKTRWGYLRVNLYKNGKNIHYSIHKLVWETFNGSVPDDYEINHINEDKTDNRLENLNLLSHCQNLNWGTRNQRVSEKQMNDPERSKHVSRFTLDWILIEEYPSLNECRRNGFNQAHVVDCCNGKRKTHKGFRFLFTADADEIIKNKIIDL